MAGKKINAGKTISKTQVIKEALGKGIESPAQISDYAKQSKGMEIDPKYVSVIKSQLKEKQGLRAARGVTSADAQREATMMFALRSGTIDRAKKNLEAVRADPAMAYAIEMGGIDKAIAALSSLASQIGTGG